MQSEYSLGAEAISSFQHWLITELVTNQLVNWSHTIEEFGDETLVDLESNDDSRVSLCLSFLNSTCLKNGKSNVVMNWAFPCPGSDKKRALCVAYLIEIQLLRLGATCLFGEVQTLAQKEGIVL